MDFDNNFNETENNNNYHPRRQHFIPRSSYQRSDRPYRPQHPRYSKPYDSRPSNDGDGERTFNSYDRKDGFKPRAYQRNGYQRDGFQRDGYQRDGYQRSGYQRNGFKSRPQRPYRKRTDDYDPSAKYNTQKVLRYKEENIDPNEPIRLNRFLANAGVCSRREADTHISAGDVKVNGIVITELGHKVLRTDEVLFKDKPVSMEDKVYILMNKPKGYVTTADDPEGRKIVMDLVKNACPERIYPVGRLDRNTTGVLLLTNDGEMAAKMMHPQYMKKKIYHVFCDKPVSFADMQKILEGITLEDGEIKADRVEYASENDRKQIGIEIHSGKNRIVRRIFENLGYKVVKLDRVYFAGLTKKNLRRGQWRFLEENEVNFLRMGAYE
ncbi:MAG: rRNA pseudouridine synthase [Bacteroidaceae bacterium]|nr:rRNA pseudouridine synthase [Bacteroidaceae bacterium]